MGGRRSVITSWRNPGDVGGAAGFYGCQRALT